jgi:hypothetical protein
MGVACPVHPHSVSVAGRVLMRGSGHSRTFLSEHTFDAVALSGGWFACVRPVKQTADSSWRRWRSAVARFDAQVYRQVIDGVQRRDPTDPTRARTVQELCYRAHMTIEDAAFLVALPGASNRLVTASIDGLVQVWSQTTPTGDWGSDSAVGHSTVRVVDCPRST